MRLRELTLPELQVLYDTELVEAFPPEERKPFAAMRTLYQAGVYHPVGAYEGETLAGYALLWDNPERTYVLIDYLGVPRAMRNRGLGGSILREITASFARWDGILVETEAPEGGPQDGLRRRRMAFYRRNGFAFLEYDCVLFGVRYAVCLASPNGKGTEKAALAAHQEIYREQFPPWAYERYVQIPRDPDHPMPPPEAWAEQGNLPGLGERSLKE